MYIVDSRKLDGNFCYRFLFLKVEEIVILEGWEEDRFKNIILFDNFNSVIKFEFYKVKFFFYFIKIGI